MSVPVPDFVKPCVPATTALIVAVRFTTSMIGVAVPDSVIVLVDGVPEATLQSLLAVVRSPNFNVPAVTLPSSVVALFAVMLSVEKSNTSSVANVGNAGVELQLVSVCQEPPVVVFVQVKVAAGSKEAERAVKNKEARMEEWYFIVSNSDGAITFELWHSHACAAIGQIFNCCTKLFIKNG